jgi:uracil-DNA glycosylase family 4
MPKKKPEVAPKITSSPCSECPLNSNIKVLPCIPNNPKFFALGLAPGATEEITGIGFTGKAGDLLRSTLKRAGVNPERDVAYANLTRCRPIEDKFDSSWKKAQRRCSEYMYADLNKFPSLPILAMGSDTAKVILQDTKLQITKIRGVWWLTPHPENRRVFPTLHPAAILRSGAEEWRRQFEKDIFTFCKRVQGSDNLPDITIGIFERVADAENVIDLLVQSGSTFAFDIETYDCYETPSRKAVSTNPFHKDFRVRGLAVAYNKNSGFWIDFKADEDNKEECKRILNKLFMSSQPKWAFHGNFDEEGLIYQGWVDGINNRSGDGLLALISLGDGRRASNTLERAVMEILNESSYWDVDKSRMAEHPTSVVAEGAVRDAVSTFKLVKILEAKLKKGEYCP